MNEQYRTFMLSWRGVSVKLKKEERNCNFIPRFLETLYSKNAEDLVILDNVHGEAESGALVAVMGPSGSGKTTLLTAISKRIEGGVEGNVFLNSQIVKRNTLIRKSGFVSQKDISLVTLTAMEHIYFMSQMKLDPHIKSEQRQFRISKLFTELGLSSCQHTQLASLSGGERKRLSIAVELLHDPLILFCDEPTTGLDSYNAFLVIEKLQSLAKMGKIVISSIHQPSSEVFFCFNRLILLSSGKLAYHGPTENVLRYFESLGYSCPPNYNPADFLIDKLAVAPGHEDACQISNEYLCQKFSESYLAETSGSISFGQIYQDELENEYNSKSCLLWFIKFYWLLWRNVIDSMRTKLGHFCQLVVFLVSSIILAIFYRNISTTTQQGIQDVHGLLYLISSEVYYTSAYRVLNTFPHEFSVFLKEKDLYPTSAYYVAKIVLMIPRTLIEPALFLAVIWIIQYFSGCYVLSYLVLLGPILISAFSASAYGCAMSAAFESSETASSVSVPLDLATMLMAGMFFNIRSLPSLIIWMKYLSQLYYTNEVLLTLHWQHIDYIECSRDITFPCIKNGTQLLETYGYSAESVPGNVTALVIMGLMLNMIGCLLLKRKAKITEFK